jgi:cytochrome c-type biogenesis protein CcmF
MIQEKRGMLKVWNAALIAATYLLCLFGTFLTRSGIVSSVHAFARSSVGAYFAVFIGIGLAASIALVWSRRRYLRSEASLESVLSRESSFFFNNLVFLVSCFAVLWGTMFPSLSEMARGEKISVGPPYFNRINVPIGLFLLFLTGLAPLLAWRRTSWPGLRRSLAGPIAFALLLGVLLFVLAVRAKYALICFTLSAFTAATIVLEFARGTRARMRRLGEPWPRALLRLPLRNPRRYGGYVAHLGVVLLFVGIAGSSYNRTHSGELAPGEEMVLGEYTLRIEGLEEGRTPNYDFARAAVALSRGSELLGTYHPERRLYRASEQPSTEVEIRSGFKEDLYLVYAAAGKGESAVIQVYRNPLVRWVWIGGIVLVAGGLVCLLPARRGETS